MPGRNLSNTLYDPRRGDRAIVVRRLCIDEGGTRDPERTNYFTIYFVQRGAGTLWVDESCFAFGPGSLLCFVPYQHIKFMPKAALRGQIIQFHANFLCVETFHEEAGCSGILFNDPLGDPIVPLTPDANAEIADFITRIEREQAAGELAFGEVMLAYLKVLLIVAARCKTSRGATCSAAASEYRLPVLMQLRELIEQHYHVLHSPAAYAKRMHMTPKTLGRIVREQLGTTPTTLIRNRILTHAKWQLLHTLKPVKEIARELGFDDELYFSRLFKKAVGYSPTFFRQFETEIRGGSNLSMFSSQAPILPSPPDSHT